MIDVLSAVPARKGHFRLESGYHTDVWLTLDALFTDQAAIAPEVDALAARLRAYPLTGVCGPFVGGAFLAQALAARLGLKFFYTQASPDVPQSGMFKAAYRLTPELRRLAAGHRLAVVDEAISAGSSVRATIAEATDAGATVVVVAALLALGETGVAHFAAAGLPLETLDRRPLVMWTPDDCPLCQSGLPLETA
jgi:orotate phosphoribosyltransferase